VPVTVQALIDGSDANTATIAQSYVLAVVARYAESIGPRHLLAASGGSVSVPTGLPIELKSRVWYNPELKSVNFIVPGVIAVIMMIVGQSWTALSIVKEKERGTIEQILVSPIRPTEMMLGKIVPYVILAFVDLMIIVTAGYFIFEVPSRAASSSSPSCRSST